MDFSGLLRRLLTDSHIDFTSFKGGAQCMPMDSPACCPAADRQPSIFCLAIAGLLAFALATGDIQLTVLLSPSRWWPGAIAETD